jgi:hypothetical protein
MAIQFTFTVDGADLSPEARAKIGQAVAAAGTLALDRELGKDTPRLAVSADLVNKWELIGKYVLAGKLAEELAQQVRKSFGGRI